MQSTLEMASGKGVDAALQQLKHDGFARLPHTLAPEDVRTLQQARDALLELPRSPFARLGAVKGSAEYSTRVLFNRDWTVALDVIGFRAEVDAILEQALVAPGVREVLSGVLGSGYKMEQANLRRAEPGGAGQPLHQDARGEFGLSILVSDCLQPGGATAFLPGSHRWPIRYGDLGFNIDPWWVRRALGSAQGEAGAVFAFFNRTWHGRFSNEQPADALMMSLYAPGAECRLREVPAPTLDRLGPELRRLLDPNQGLERIAPARARVCTSPGSTTVDPVFRAVLTDEIEDRVISRWLPMKVWRNSKNATRRVVRRLIPARGPQSR